MNSSFVSFTKLVESRNLETYVDEVGNLIIRKNATQGKEHVSGVILQ